MSESPQSLVRRIPKVDRLLQEPEIESLIERHGRAPVVEAIRSATDSLRARALAGSAPSNGDLLPALKREIAAAVEGRARRSLRRAINATGVVLHTGLGRAALSEAAAQASFEAARSHSLLEVDPESGERGSRLSHIAPLLRELTGAEDAAAVNNNAAAVFLSIAALAQGREVIISRGQLVEIGGSFRIPDVIRSGGAKLVEVGTTNKVRARDYEAAITPETALILRVHPSNFRIVGFTEEPSLAELVEVGRRHGVPVMDDLGSGALVDLTRYGLVAEPTVQESVRAGADLITFSGDKLLGGPQAGLIIGQRELVSQVKRHPLMRAVRLDKMTLAGIEATLRLYRDEAKAMREIPTLAALSLSAEALRARAERLASLLGGVEAVISLEPGISQVGGGALPGEELPTTLVCLFSESVSAGELSRRLRVGEPSVWARVQRDRLVLDPRTIRDEELDELAAAVASALRAG
ncbi:MAG: L-seryl-tRNA(Sec) selenium transferase [Armatimonadota bacterium]